MPPPLPQFSIFAIKKPRKMRGLRNLVLWKRLELSRGNPHKYLKLARLPIPPPELLHLSDIYTHYSVRIKQ